MIWLLSLLVSGLTDAIAVHLDTGTFHAVTISPFIRAGCLIAALNSGGVAEYLAGDIQWYAVASHLMDESLAVYLSAHLDPLSGRRPLLCSVNLRTSGVVREAIGIRALTLLAPIA